METIELLETVISEMQSEEQRLVITHEKTKSLAIHQTQSGNSAFYGGRLHQLRKHLSYLQQHLNRELDSARYTTAEYQKPSCVLCGCTEEHACEHGCSWVQIDPPVCSRCVSRLVEVPVPTAPAAQGICR